MYLNCSCVSTIAKWLVGQSCAWNDVLCVEWDIKLCALTLYVVLYKSVNIENPFFQFAAVLIADVSVLSHCRFVWP